MLLSNKKERYRMKSRFFSLIFVISVIVMGIAVMSGCLPAAVSSSDGLPRARDLPRPTFPRCEHERFGIEGFYSFDSTHILEDGTAINHCKEYLDDSYLEHNWRAYMWSSVPLPEDKGHDLSEFYVIQNGKVLRASRMFDFDGRNVMFDTSGYAYFQDKCPDVFDPTDTIIVYQGRTEWQAICYAQSIYNYR